eukprot:3549610-Alexandrium_andersonii.AAC.1
MRVLCESEPHERCGDPGSNCVSGESCEPSESASESVPAASESSTKASAERLRRAGRTDGHVTSEPQEKSSGIASGELRTGSSSSSSLTDSRSSAVADASGHQEAS